MNVVTSGKANSTHSFKECIYLLSIYATIWLSKSALFKFPKLDTYQDAFLPGWHSLHSFAQGKMF